MRRVAAAALPRYGLEGTHLTLLGHAVNAVFRVAAPPEQDNSRCAVDVGAARRFALRVYRPAGAGYVGNNWVLSWPSPDAAPWGPDYLARSVDLIRAFLDM